MSDDAEKPLRDYRETVFLPETPVPDARRPAAGRAASMLERLGDLYPVIRASRGRRRARRSTCCTTGRPTPTARSTSAMR